MSIQAYRDKWAESSAAQEEGDLDRRDQLRTQAKTIAQEYVKANEGRLNTKYGDMSEDELISLVTFYRAQDRQDDVTELTMYIMANFAPKVIKGSMGPGPRIIRMRGR